MRSIQLWNLSNKGANIFLEFFSNNNHLYLYLCLIAYVESRIYPGD